MIPTCLVELHHCGALHSLMLRSSGQLCSPHHPLHETQYAAGMLRFHGLLCSPHHPLHKCSAVTADVKVIAVPQERLPVPACPGHKAAFLQTALFCALQTVYQTILAWLWPSFLLNSSLRGCSPCRSLPTLSDALLCSKRGALNGVQLFGCPLRACSETIVASFVRVMLCCALQSWHPLK